jgi:DNA polymerase sigma
LIVTSLNLGGEMNVTERIQKAEARIKELQLLIQHWKKNEKQKGGAPE